MLLEIKIEEIEIVPFKDNKRHLTNPYLKNGLPENIKIRKKRKTHDSKDEVILNQRTGERTGIASLTRFHKVDSTQYVKLYTSGMARWLGLSKKAQTILVYIMHNLKPNNDMVVVDVENNEVKLSTGYTAKSSLYRGLSELIQAQIIAKAKWKDHFYINPGFMFNGDRFVFADVIEKNNGSERKVDEVGESVGEGESDLKNLLTE